MDAPLNLSFSMLSWPWKWGQNSNLALKLERSYHRKHVYYVLSRLYFNFIKNYLDQMFILKQDRQKEEQKDELMHRQIIILPLGEALKI